MHALELKMEYPVKNDCIRWFKTSCCDWGQRMPTYDAQNNIVGRYFMFFISVLLLYGLILQRRFMLYSSY